MFLKIIKRHVIKLIITSELWKRIKRRRQNNISSKIEIGIGFNKLFFIICEHVTCQSETNYSCKIQIFFCFLFSPWLLIITGF